MRLNDGTYLKRLNTKKREFLVSMNKDSEIIEIDLNGKTIIKSEDDYDDYFKMLTFVDNMRKEIKEQWLIQ